MLQDSSQHIEENISNDEWACHTSIKPKVQEYRHRLPNFLMQDRRCWCCLIFAKWQLNGFGSFLLPSFQSNSVSYFMGFKFSVSSSMVKLEEVIQLIKRTTIDLKRWQGIRLFCHLFHYSYLSVYLGGREVLCMLQCLKQTLLLKAYKQIIVVVIV